MAEQKESSVLFSLKELMNLEEDRIRQEATARKAKQDAEVQARLDIERRQREDEEARIRGEEDRRRAEEQLAQSVAQLNSLLTHAPIGFAFFDREHKFVRVNEYLGYNGVGSTAADKHMALEDV